MATWTERIWRTNILRPSLRLCPPFIPPVGGSEQTGTESLRPSASAIGTFLQLPGDISELIHHGNHHLGRFDPPCSLAVIASHEPLAKAAKGCWFISWDGSLLMLLLMLNSLAANWRRRHRWSTRLSEPRGRAFTPN